MLRALARPLLALAALTAACRTPQQTAARRPTAPPAALVSGPHARTDAGAEGDVFPGKPVVRLCKKEWSHEQCCAFLCSCLDSVCPDSPRSAPGIASCPSWCPGLSDKAMRCHVYHCYDSISPTGGIKDHDSHCRHASDQLPGGGCPALVYSSPPDAGVTTPSPP